MKISRILIAVLFLMVIIALAATCSASASETEYTFTYEVLSDGTASITGLSDNSYVGDIVIPETIDGYTVTEIGDSAFWGVEVTSIVMPDTVVRMGEDVFYWGTELKNVTLSKNLKEIGSYAFHGCSSVAFVDIPDSVTKIGDGVFGRSGLKAAVLPDSIVELGENLFEDCYELESVVLPKGITEIPSGLFNYCNSLEHVDIPAGVKTIGESAFASSGLKKVVIPDGVETIGALAFFTDTLESAVIPESVTSLGVVLSYDDEEGEAEEYCCEVFDNAVTLYVYEGSAGQAHAEAYGLEHVVLNGETPVIFDIAAERSENADYCIGETAVWTVQTFGASDLSYYFRLYRDGETIVSQWQDVPEFSYTFEETGTYSLKVVVKSAEGVKSEYYWVKSFFVVDEIAEVPTISDFTLHTAQEISMNTPISWSYYISGGNGDFGDLLEDSYTATIDGETPPYTFDLELDWWHVNGGLFVKGRCASPKSGVYRISTVPTDSTGAMGAALVFPEITVKDSAFKITDVTHDMYSYIYEEEEYNDETGEFEYVEKTMAYTHEGDTVTWKVSTEGATGEVIYTLRILQLEVGPTELLMQVVSETPEFSAVMEGLEYKYPSWQLIAYDTGSGESASTDHNWFDYYYDGRSYFPFEWYVVQDESELLIGEAYTWHTEDYSNDEEYQQKIDSGAYRFRYEFYLDEEPVYESEWSTSSEVEYSFEKAGEAKIVCCLEDENGFVHKEECWIDVIDPDAEPEPDESEPEEPEEEVTEYYLEGTYSYYEGNKRIWEISFFHEDESCWEENCEHMNVRYTLYRDGEAIDVSDWHQPDGEYSMIPDDYGVYDIGIELMDENGVIVGTWPNTDEPCKVRKAEVTGFGMGDLYDGAIFSGDTVVWQVFADGGVDINNNLCSATLYCDGEVYAEYDWTPMYVYDSAAITYCGISTDLPKSGLYKIEAQVKDSKGSISEKVMSKEILVLPGTESELDVKAVYCNWIALSLKSEEKITWKAITTGGIGAAEYAFTILRNGEVYKEFDWKKSNTLIWKPDAEGSYSVKVAARDESGAVVECVQETSVVVIDSEEHPVTAVKTSAAEIYAYPGEKYIVGLAVEPANASVKRIFVESSDESVATVDENGLIEIVGEGDAEITISTWDGSGVTGTIRIHVGEYSMIAPPESITLIDAEAFAGSAFAGLDLTNTSGVTLASGALDGSAIRRVYITDDTILEKGAFGESPAVVFCANEQQADIADEAGVSFVIVK